MGKKNGRLKSGNIILTPQVPSECDDFLTNFEGNELLSVFLENREKAIEEYDNRSRDYFFHTIWRIDFYDKETKKETLIGFLNFDGPAFMGLVNLYIFIYPEYKNKGYGTNAIKMITEWAFNQKDVYEIQGKFHQENDGAIHAFTKAGYVYREVEHHIERYSITKGPEIWGGVYFVIGIWVGLILGVVLNSLWVGLIMGIVIGALFGVILEQKEVKHREEITGTTLKNRRELNKKRSKTHVEESEQEKEKEE